MIASIIDRPTPDLERLAGRLLAISVAAYVALALWLSRGISFTLDEFIYFAQSRGFDPGSIAAPLGEHLTAPTRIFYEASLRLFGTEHLPFQLFTIATAAAVPVLLFALIRPRIGPLPALAVAVLILFLGSTPEVLLGRTMVWTQATAAGLAAFLALDRRGPGRDALACVLLVVAVLSFSVGVAFAVGAGAWILTQGSRRRLWIAAVPLAIYFAWWLWALKFDEGTATAVNVLLTPAWAADSLAAAVAALTGLSVDLSRESATGTGPGLTTPLFLEWGRVLAVVGVGLLAVRLRRSGPSPMLWGALALLATLWLAGAVSYEGAGGFGRLTDAARYAYPVAIGVLLVLAAGFTSERPARRVALAIIAVAAFALPVNLWQMGEQGEFIREESDLARARATIIELERERLPSNALEVDRGLIPVLASDYLTAVDRFGSLGYSDAELAAASPRARLQADAVLATIVAPTLTPLGPAGESVVCGPEHEELSLSPGRSLLRSRDGGPLRLRRFADSETIRAGSLMPGKVARVTLPSDASSVPWVAAPASGGVALCEAGGD